MFSSSPSLRVFHLTLPPSAFPRHPLSTAPLPFPFRSTRELAEEGYSGCEVRVTHARTEIIIRATHTQEVLGDKGRRIRELKALVEKRFKFSEGSLELYAEKVQFRGLSAVAQAESLRYKLLGGLAMRRSVLSPCILHHLGIPPGFVMGC